MAILIQDTFTRTSTTTLGTTDTGQAWTAVSGIWGTIGNEAYCVSDTDASRAILPSVGTGNYIVNISMKGQQNSGERKPAVLFRYIDTSNWIAVDANSSGLYLYKSDAGSVSTMSSNLTAKAADNTYYTLQIVCNSSNVKIYFNSVLSIDYNLTTPEQTKYGSSGIIGINLWKAGSPTIAARWDNLTVTTLSTMYPVNLSDTITITESLSKRRIAVIIDTLPTSDTESDKTSKTLTDSVTNSETLFLKRGVNPLDTIAITDTIRKALSMLRTDNVTTSESERESTTKTIIDALTQTDSIWVTGGKTVILSESLTVIDSLAKASVISKSDEMTLIDTISRTANVSVRLFDLFLTIDSIQLIKPNTQTLISRIELIGERNLYVYLNGLMKSRLKLIGFRQLYVSLRGDLMAATGQNFDMYPGETRIIEIPEVTESDGSSINLTGATVEWVVRKNKGSPDLVNKTADYNNGFEMNLAKNDTVNLQPGPYYHVAQLTDAAGNESIILTGTLMIKNGGI